MKIRFLSLTVALLVMVMNAAAAANPIEANIQDVRVSLSRFKIRTIWANTKGQAMPNALASVSFAGLQSTGSITGQVVLPSGQQVSNRVKITLNGYRISGLTAYTDNKGRFSIPNIGDGTYTLEVEGDRDLYEPVSQEVRVIYGAHPALVITLREKKNSVNKQSSNVVSAGEIDERVPDEARREFEKGAQMSERGEIQDAVKCFKKAIAIFPSYLMARNNLGAQYLKLGKWSDAAEQFAAAIQIDAKALNPRQNIAIALIEQKKYVEALGHLNHALSIDSSSPVTHLYAGIASIGVEEIDQAERELLLALSLGGADYSNAHFYLALVYIKKNERDPARRELMAYLEKLPQGEKAARARELLGKLK